MIVVHPEGRVRFEQDHMAKVSLFRSDRMMVGLNAFEPGQSHEAHRHAGQDKLYVVLEGTADLTIGEDRALLGPGDVALAPAGTVHGLRNPGPERAVVLVVMSPAPRRKKND